MQFTNRARTAPPGFGVRAMESAESPLSDAWGRSRRWVRHYAAESGDSARIAPSPHSKPLARLLRARGLLTLGVCIGKPGKSFALTRLEASGHSRRGQSRWATPPGTRAQTLSRAVSASQSCRRQPIAANEGMWPAERGRRCRFALASVQLSRDSKTSSTKHDWPNTNNLGTISSHRNTLSGKYRTA